MNTINETFTPASEPTTIPQGGASPFIDRSAFTAAFEKRLAQIRAVPDAEFIAMNLDVHACVTTVLGALPEIVALRDRIQKLPELDQSNLDGLEEYAQAAGEANSRYVTAVAPNEDIIALNEEAQKIREMFRSDATALANRGLIDPARVAQFKGLIGYKNVAFDLIDWANLLRDCWPTIEGRTALTVEEIQHGKDVGERLVRITGQKEQGPAVVMEAARIRQQAVTLFVAAYDQVRRAVTFLRWNQEDADTIAPSLYAGRQRGKPVAAGTPAPQPAPNGGGTQPAPAAAAPQPVTPPVATAPVGMPGASPFAN